MKLIAPDYIDLFRCAAGECRHTCCAGWDIDIDEETAEFYLEMPGELGERLRAAMARGEDGTWHFELDGEGRCPMLQRDGLCSLICSLGEESLCQICADHPRFRSFFADRTELGLGLCCEAAVRLILRRQEPFALVVLDDDGEEAERSAEETVITMVRGRLIRRMTDRQIPLIDRVESLCGMVNADPPPAPETLQPVYEGLERLDASWSEALRLLSEVPAAPVSGAFDIPFEQLMVTLLYRQVAAVVEDDCLQERVALCVALWQLVRALFARGPQEQERLEELVRLMSSELEYSDENIGELLPLLY